jgi:DNA-binding NarL/FixJ family response regulator
VKKLGDIELLLLTEQDDELTISVGLAAGARGYLVKSDSAAYLVTAVKALAAHRSFFSPVVSDLLLGTTLIKPAKLEVASFTGRELEVIQFVTAGVRNVAIAERLGSARRRWRAIGRRPCVRRARIRRAL